MLNVKLTRGEAIKMYEVLAGPMSDFGRANRKFVYALMKNTKVLEGEVKMYNDLKKVFEEQRIELLKKYSVKENDEPLLVQTGPDTWEYKIEPEDRPKFDEEYKELAKEHGVDVLLTDEIELQFYPIDFETVPENVTLLQMQMLDKMLENENGSATP